MSQRTLITKPPFDTKPDNILVLVTCASTAAFFLETPCPSEQQSTSDSRDAGEIRGREE